MTAKIEPGRPIKSRPISMGTALRVGVETVVFLILVAAAWHHTGPLGLDRWLVHGYVPRKSSAFFRLNNAITVVGSPGIVVVLAFVCAVIVLVRWGSLAWAAACFAAPGVAGVAETLGKSIIGRPRPATAALTGEDGMGFPSGHAAGFTALVVILVLMTLALTPRRPRLATGLVVGAVLAAVVMAITRVVVGAHYPTDVIAGMALGAVVAEVAAIVAPILSQFLDRLPRDRFPGSLLTRVDALSVRARRAPVRPH